VDGALGHDQRRQAVPAERKVFNSEGSASIPDEAIQRFCYQIACSPSLHAKSPCALNVHLGQYSLRTDSNSYAAGCRS